MKIDINLIENDNLNKKPYKTHKKSPKLSPILSPKSPNFNIPSLYKKLYNDLKTKCRYYRPVNEYYGLKFIFTDIENDLTDDFFPYKCQIEMKQIIKDNEQNINERSTIYEIFFSSIMAKYTIRNISNNKGICEFEIDNYLNTFGFNSTTNLLNNMLIQFKNLFIKK